MVSVHVGHKCICCGPNTNRDHRWDSGYLLEHGRWSRGIKIAKDGEEFTIRRADPDAIMMVSDD